MQTGSQVLEKFIKLYGYRPTEFDRRYLELLEMGRYRVLAVPDVSPGKCVNCGSARNDGRKYLDTGRHVEWYGAIFICGLCCREYAEAMGVLDTIKAEIEEVKAKLLSQQTLIEQGERLHETVLHTFEEVKSHYVNLHSLGDNSNSDSSADVESDKATSTKSAATKSEQGTSKSTTSTGRKDIRSLTELLNN